MAVLQMASVQSWGFEGKGHRSNLFWRFQLLWDPWLQTYWFSMSPTVCQSVFFSHTNIILTHRHDSMCPQLQLLPVKLIDWHCFSQSPLIDHLRNKGCFYRWLARVRGTVCSYQIDKAGSPHSRIKARILVSSESTLNN